MPTHYQIQTWPRYQKIIVGIVYAGLFVIFELLARAFAVGSGVSLWYPGAGLSIAYAYFAGPLVLPFMVVSTLVSGLLTYPDNSPIYVIGSACAHVALYGGAGIQLRRFGVRPALDQVPHVTLFGLVIGLAALGVALLGNLLLIMTTDLSSARYIGSVLNWWLGDTVGAFVLAGFLLPVGFQSLSSLLGKAPWPTLKASPLETLLQMMLLALVVWIVLLSQSLPYLPLFYFFPPMIWIALRSGTRGTALALLMLNFGVGLSIRQQPHTVDELIMLQQVMLVLTATAMILAALVEQQWSTNRQIRQSEERARAIVQDQLELVCRYTPDTILTFVNEAYCRFFGKPASQLIGNSFFSLVEPGEFPRLQQQIAYIIETRNTIEDETQITHADGTTRWIQWNKRAINTETDAPEIQVVGRDITERRRAEEAYRTLVDQSIQGLVIVQGEQLVFVNPAFCSMLGYSANELMSLNSLLPIVAPEDQPGLIRELLTLDQQNWSGRTFEIRVVQKQGDIRWVLIALVSTLYADRSAIMAMIIDITERKQAEEALQRSEQRYRIVSELISDYTYAYYPRPDGTFVAEWLAGAFEQITGYTTAEVDAKGGFSSIVHPDDLPSMLERRKLLPKGQPYLNEIRIIRKDGQIRHLHAWVRPQLNAAGQIECIYGAARDVTERVQAEQARAAIEQQLQETQKLESLGLLAGGIAHDFNNLLVAVMGHAEIAELQLPSDSPTAEHIRQIMVAASHGADLTRQLLAYSGKGQVTIRPIEVNSLIEEAIELLRLGVPRKITLRQHLTPQLPRIEGDVTQLRQVLMNIVLNGAEAIGPHPGSITITTSTRIADQTYLRAAALGTDLPAGHYVAINITDTGRGMDEATRQRIFEPFFTTKANGRGLGLAAVLGIVRSHHGALRLDSTLGRGSSFTVLLPALEQRQIQTEQPDSASSPPTRPEGSLVQ